MKEQAVISERTAQTSELDTVSVLTAETIALVKELIAAAVTGQLSLSSEAVA